MFTRLAAIAVLCLMPVALSAQEGGRKLALLVGVGDYEHASLDPLKFSENDVTVLGQLLEKSGYEVVLLCDSAGKRDASLKPTYKNIRGQMAKIVKNGKRTDTILVGFSGHGLQFDDEREPFFCPTDARPSSKKAERENLLAISDVMNTLSDSGIGTKLLLIDACRNDPVASRSLDTTNVRPPKETAVLFSCSKDQRAFESAQFKHGIFFHYVIEGLKGDARNARNEVTWGGLLDYVQDQVTTSVPKIIGDGARQEPNSIGNLQGKSPVLVRINPDAPITIVKKEPAPVIVKKDPIPDVPPAPKSPIVGNWICNFMYQGVMVTYKATMRENGTFYLECHMNNGQQTKVEKDYGTYRHNQKQLTLTSKVSGATLTRSIVIDGKQATIYDPDLNLYLKYQKVD
ncbi:MAG: caspase family protein [Planctomycetes bacterium]|nr:caspase family protein [Planctomycetota bacterium]